MDAVLGTLPGEKAKIVRSPNFKNLRAFWVEKGKLPYQQGGRLDAGACMQITGPTPRFFWENTQYRPHRRVSDFNVASLIRRYPRIYDTNHVHVCNVLMTCADPGERAPEVGRRIVWRPADRPFANYRREGGFNIAFYEAAIDIGRELPSRSVVFNPKFEENERRRQKAFWESSEGQELMGFKTMSWESQKTIHEYGSKDERSRLSQCNEIIRDKDRDLSSAIWKDIAHKEQHWRRRKYDILWSFDYYRHHSGLSIASVMGADSGRLAVIGYISTTHLMRPHLTVEQPNVVIAQFPHVPLIGADQKEDDSETIAPASN